MPVDIEAVVDATRYWITRVRRGPRPMPEEPALREMRVGVLYEYLDGVKRPYEFGRDELFDILSPPGCRLLAIQTPYRPLSPQMLARWRGLCGPPPAAPGTNKTRPPLTPETARWLDEQEERQSTPEGLLQLENEHYEREEAQAKEIARLRQAAMRYLAEDENLLVEAEIGGWRRQIVSYWRLEELEQEAQAAEESAGSAPEATAIEPQAEAGAAGDADEPERPAFNLDREAARMNTIKVQSEGRRPGGGEAAAHAIDDLPGIRDDAQARALVKKAGYRIPPEEWSRLVRDGRRRRRQPHPCRFCS